MSAALASADDPHVGAHLPAGTVTFLFTDVEGSTRLLHELGVRRYAEVLAEHRRILRDAFRTNGGVEVDTQGDAFFVAFPTATGALAAAAEGLQGLASGPIRVRMGIHTGTPHVGTESYVGVDVHRAARIAACGHGGQVLVSASTASLVGTDGLRDLGEHRLKDLSAPERIYQLGDGDFPPLESLHQTNLPIPSTPFLGREQRAERGARAALAGGRPLAHADRAGRHGQDAPRRPGGRRASPADRYPHGVWWVPLAPLRDPELVLATAGRALGSKNGLAEHIADKRLLLLFDNFEHVVDAAADLAALLTSCPQLELLVTSREPLHVTGEQEYAVPPFAHEEGVGFFLARARAVEPDFQADEAVPEICRRLDDLPLALELAAASVKVLSPEQILERLDQRLPLLTGGARDAPERQRTLRATIEWSHELLSPEEQRLFARTRRLLGRLHARSGGGGRGGRSGHAALARRQEPAPLLRGSLLDAGDDPRVRAESGSRRTVTPKSSGYDMRTGISRSPRRSPQQRRVEGNYDRLEQEHDNFRAALAAFRQAGRFDLGASAHRPPREVLVRRRAPPRGADAVGGCPGQSRHDPRA